MIYCVVLMPVIWNFESMLLAIGQKPVIASLAQDYMRIAQWGILPGLLLMVMKSYLSALERPAWLIGLFLASFTLVWRYWRMLVSQRGGMLRTAAVKAGITKCHIAEK